MSKQALRLYGLGSKIRNGITQLPGRKDKKKAVEIMETTELLRRQIALHQEEIIEDLKELVRCESPSIDKSLADVCGRKIDEIVKKRLGCDAKIYPAETRGDHRSFTIGEGEEQILMLCHFDTVWEKGRLSLKQEGDLLYGPGVFDMKSGLVNAIWALKILKEQGLLPHKRFCLMCNSDEEVGSVSSRPVIEAKARESAAALCIEPASGPQGFLKTARKGSGKYQIEITGKAAHAGNNPQAGRSAVQEMALQTVYLHSLNDFEIGTTVNVGVVNGGTRPNIIAERAHMEVDVRTWNDEEARRMDRLIFGLQPKTEGVSLKVTGGIARPGMEATEKNLKLFDLAQSAARELGVSLDYIAAGGGSDGNFTSALGIATLDGLGGKGDGAHAENEHIEISGTMERLAVLANFLTKL